MLGPVNFSVLMVDDNAAMREAIARSLTRRGCQVATAVSGVTALEALRAQSFDVIISDLNMPERGTVALAAGPGVAPRVAGSLCAHRLGAPPGAADHVALLGVGAVLVEAAYPGHSV